MIGTREILADVARVVADISGIEGASYPMIDTLPKSPWAFVLWGTLDADTEIRHEMGSELWTVPFVIRVAVAHQSGGTAAELAMIDTLLERIQAVFSPMTGTRPNDVLNVAGHVDQLRVARLRPGLKTEIGGTACYAGDAMMRLMYRRVQD